MEGDVDDAPIGGGQVHGVGFGICEIWQFRVRGRKCRWMQAGWTVTRFSRAAAAQQWLVGVPCTDSELETTRNQLPTPVSPLPARSSERATRPTPLPNLQRPRFQISDVNSHNGIVHLV